MRRLIKIATVITLFVWIGASQAADLNPAAITITMPDQLKWVSREDGNSTAVLFGDPNKPGMYGVLTKWSPGHMSRPHFHPNDRYIYVISGTWWVGTGPKFDPSMTKPLPPGSFVVHKGKEIHWDGAKDVECLLEIVGMGPATSTPAEAK
jgi:quercetin dioxygenase-like cupin family protein